jgi:hypothetical protein
MNFFETRIMNLFEEYTNWDKGFFLSYKKIPYYERILGFRV